MHAIMYIQTCARYDVYVHVQPMHAIMYAYVQTCARYNAYVHVQPMHSIKYINIYIYITLYM